MDGMAMITQNDISGKLALDSKSLDQLHQAAKQNSPEAVRGAAKQFEALFLNMVMKSMREAAPQDGPFDSQETRSYTSMLDQQISQNLASRGIGLADVLTRQLSNNRGMTLDPALQGQGAAAATGQQGSVSSSSAGKSITQTPATLPTAAPVDDSKSHRHQAPHVRAFRDKLTSQAEEASRTTGIPAKFMLGQAALESGWGKREILAADGSTSHNVFGIKAGPSWTGKVVEATTTEYVNGVPHTVRAKFRAYDTYADAFRDYAKLLSNNPRYQKVLANAQDAVGFAQGLQRAGYATDPHYAAKLTSIIKRSLAT
jgi:peptidoglycan hydrolase FlgJ